MAKIQLNGRKITIKRKISVLDLLRRYKLDKKKVAIELNGKIINKNSYANKEVKNNDKFEIVHFIGGG
jgi:sulfur carrier protein|tara:strand:+ start:328 stop:531 length:204 start_codon:yes stop_codon:yes gene_type:complete